MEQLAHMPRMIMNAEFPLDDPGDHGRGPDARIQAIAGAELLRRRRGIERVLVVAPASVKYQWKTEIEKFCNLPAQVIDGLMPHRKKRYASPTFFNLTIQARINKRTY